VTAMTVLGISGSLRRDSRNSQLLRAAQELAPAGVTIELYQELSEIPPYSEDDDTPDAPPAVRRLRTRVAAADAVLVATPEYNSSVPGQLKNALDWLSRPILTNPLRNKPVAVMGASSGAYGAVWAQAELRKVLGAIGARVVEGDVALGHAHERFAEDGRLADAEIADQVRELVADLAAQVRERRALLAGAA
jgi:chromate reductase, NAD(P)H dehydrogenase (quinone)